MRINISRVLLTLAASIVFLALLLVGFFGAVLQESYKLCPVTAEEIQR